MGFVPFELDENLQRIDTTRVHVAVREALVNTLVHAVYDATTPIRIVKRESSYEFRNPGRLRLPREQVFEGGMSDCRNPAIQTMFQMIGAGERAGSGFPTILRAWEEQQWRSPKLEQSIEIECTTLTLSLTSLLPPDAVDAVRMAVGEQFDQLDHNTRAVLVTAWLEDHVTHERLMQVLEIHSRDLTLLLEKLVREGLLERLGTGRGCYYQLSESVPRLADSSSPTKETSSHTKETSSHTKDASSHTKDASSHTKDASSHTKGTSSHPSESTLESLQQIAKPIRETRRAQRADMDDMLVRLCTEGPLTLSELAELVGRKPTGLRDRYLTRLAKEGRIRMGYPERITHPHQAYIAVEDDPASEKVNT